jgi:hypothetical protein
VIRSRNAKPTLMFLPVTRKGMSRLLSDAGQATLSRPRRYRPG